MSDDELISIHAPSRERLNLRRLLRNPQSNFNPRSLAGATAGAGGGGSGVSNFNPRSLAGATAEAEVAVAAAVFQSTLPRGSDGR